MPRAADEEELNGPTRALKCESRGTGHRGTELSASGGDGRWKSQVGGGRAKGLSQWKRGSQDGEQPRGRLASTAG